MFSETNSSDIAQLSNSWELSDIVRYNRFDDRDEVKYNHLPPNVDVSIAADSLEQLDGNYKAHQFSHARSGITANRTGSHVHIQGSHDGTDDPNNLGPVQLAVNKSSFEHLQKNKHANRQASDHRAEVLHRGVHSVNHVGNGNLTSTPSTTISKSTETVFTTLGTQHQVDPTVPITHWKDQFLP